jgi:hypothetical protein
VDASRARTRAKLRVRVGCMNGFMNQCWCVGCTPSQPSTRRGRAHEGGWTPTLANVSSNASSLESEAGGLAAWPAWCWKAPPEAKSLVAADAHPGHVWVAWIEQNVPFHGNDDGGNPQSTPISAEGRSSGLAMASRAVNGRPSRTAATRSAGRSPSSSRTLAGPPRPESDAETVVAIWQCQRCRLAAGSTCCTSPSRSSRGRGVAHQG